MKQIFTQILAFSLLTLSVNSYSQTCGTGGTFTAGTTNPFNTTAEGFTGNFSWTSAGSGELESTPASAGQIKKLTTPFFYMPVSTTTLYWRFLLAGTMNVQSYSVVAYYYVGSTLTSIPVCNGGSLSTTGSTLTFNAPTPAQIAGKTFQLEITFNSTTNSSSKVLNVDDFSTNAINSNISLPIKLLSFQGAVVNSKAQLNWLVDDNHTGDRFQIEKSNDGKIYSVNSIIFSSAKVGTETYTYTESAKLEGGAYFRIKIINKDNSISYSKVVYLKNTNGTTTEEITLLQNPIQSALAFSFNATESAPAKVNLYNMAGVKVYSFNIAIQKGTNTIVEPVDNKIAKGTYILEVSSTTQRRPVKVIN